MNRKQSIEPLIHPKNDLGVDKEQLKTMIRGLTKWYVKIGSTAVGAPNTAVGLLYDDVMFGIDRLPSITPQEPRKGHWIDGHCSECGCDVPAYIVDWKWQKDMDAKFCPNCGAKMESEET